jgi:Uma2 family endonuclease
MTTEELLAMPEDGVERFLIRGQLWEIRPGPEENGMTKRNRAHSRVMARVTHLLERWREVQAEPRGEVACGEAGFILRHDPDSTVGIDVAYVSPDTLAVQTDQTTLYDGPPVLAVEILSPSTTHEEMTAKVRDYLDCGVRLVWVVNPDFQTVTILRPGTPAAALDVHGTITGDPELPGFSCPVADFFR